MDDFTIGIQKQPGGVKINFIFSCKFQPLALLHIKMGTDKVGIVIIGGSVIVKYIGVHPLAGTAPGSVTIIEDQFAARFCLREKVLEWFGLKADMLLRYAEAAKQQAKNNYTLHEHWVSVVLDDSNIQFDSDKINKIRKQNIWKYEIYVIALS